MVIRSQVPPMRERFRDYPISGVPPPWRGEAPCLAPFLVMDKKNKQDFRTRTNKYVSTKGCEDDIVHPSLKNEDKCNRRVTGSSPVRGARITSEHQAYCKIDFVSDYLYSSSESIVPAN